jgi:hypothetical protein
MEEYPTTPERSDFEEIIEKFAESLPNLIQALQAKDSKKIYEQCAALADGFYRKSVQHDLYDLHLLTVPPKPGKENLALDDVRSELKGNQRRPVIVKYGEVFYLYGINREKREVFVNMAKAWPEDDVDKYRAVISKLDFKKSHYRICAGSNGEDIIHAAVKSAGHYHKSFSTSGLVAQLRDSKVVAEFIRKITPECLQLLSFLKGGATKYKAIHADFLDDSTDVSVLYCNALVQAIEVIFDLSSQKIPEDSVYVKAVMDYLSRESKDVESRAKDCGSQWHDKDYSNVLSFLFSKPFFGEYRLNSLLEIITGDDKQAVFEALVKYSKEFLKVLGGKKISGGSLEEFWTNTEYVENCSNFRWTMDAYLSLLDLKSLIAKKAEESNISSDISKAEEILSPLIQCMNFLLEISPLKRQYENQYFQYINAVYPYNDYRPVTPGRNEKLDGRRGSVPVFTPVYNVSHRTELTGLSGRSSMDSRVNLTKRFDGAIDQKGKKQKIEQSTGKKVGNIILGIYSIPFALFIGFTNLFEWISDKFGASKEVRKVGLVEFILNLLFRPQTLSNNSFDGKYKLLLMAFHLFLWLLLATVLAPQIIAEELLPMTLSTLEFMGLSAAQEFAMMCVFAYTFTRQVGYYLLDFLTKPESEKVGPDVLALSEGEVPGPQSNSVGDVYKKLLSANEGDSHRLSRSDDDVYGHLVITVYPPETSSSPPKVTEDFSSTPTFSC